MRAAAIVYKGYFRDLFADKTTAHIVEARTDHPSSSYGIPVWVVKNGKMAGDAIGQVGMPMLCWTIIDRDTGEVIS